MSTTSLSPRRAAALVGCLALAAACVFAFPCGAQAAPSRAYFVMRSTLDPALPPSPGGNEYQRYVKPHDLTLITGFASSIDLADLSWSSWGARHSDATGTGESCHGESCYSWQVHLRAAHRVKYRGRYRYNSVSVDPLRGYDEHPVWLPVRRAGKPRAGKRRLARAASPTGSSAAKVRMINPFFEGVAVTPPKIRYFDDTNNLPPTVSNLDWRSWGGSRAEATGINEKGNSVDSLSRPSVVAVCRTWTSTPASAPDRRPTHFSARCAL